ncbi:hypothetical protein BX666DRAFT_2023205 [Dichotomocladium elegans]|nr:hypothetical protein BX666DRAFT_2023205 [Dichotomocladium elegans]
MREIRLLDAIIKRDRRRRNSLPSDNGNESDLRGVERPSENPRVRIAPHSNYIASDVKTNPYQGPQTFAAAGFVRSLEFLDKDTSHLANLSQGVSLGSLDGLTATASPAINQEPSPPYTCTVYKMGNVRVKQECTATGSSLKNKSWRKRYVKLWGTLLYFYSSKRDATDPSRHPLRTLSMQCVEAGLAPEYNRKLRVLRLRVPGGEQLLLKLATPKEMISWVEHLQAAANISVDLDHRKMPRFATMVRPNNNNPFGRTFNVELGAHQRTVITVCNSRNPS